jgi:hypothetical protein
MLLGLCEAGLIQAVGISSDPDTDTYRPERAEGITGRLGRIFNRRHA